MTINCLEKLGRFQRMPLEQDLDVCQRKKGEGHCRYKKMYIQRHQQAKKEVFKNKVLWLGYNIRMARNKDQNMSAMQRSSDF